MGKYEYKTMIDNMAVYLYFYKNGREKKEQAFVLQHRQVQVLFKANDYNI